MWKLREKEDNVEKEDKVEKVDESRRGFFKKLGIGTMGAIGTVALGGNVIGLESNIDVVESSEKVTDISTKTDATGATLKRQWNDRGVEFLEYEIPSTSSAIFYNEDKNSQINIPMYNLSLREVDEATLIDQVIRYDYYSPDNNINTKYEIYKDYDSANVYCYIIRVFGRPELIGIIRSYNTLVYDGNNPYRHVG